MKTRRSLTRLSIAALIVIGTVINIYPFSDQTTSERILRENKLFVDFINVCISNFAENKTKEFKSAYEKHFNADVAYLQADYRRAYKRIYSSQGILTKVYSDIVKDFYLEDSKNILDRIAPLVIRSKNARARLFLTLGYRDRTVSWTYFTISEASNPKLHSYKIYKYMKAVKMARRAKRYAFLALFESQKDKVKKKIYHQMLRNENKNGLVFYRRFVDLKEDDFIKELGKTYNEYESSMEKKGDTHGKEYTKTFEKRVEKRVRFRREKRAARFILNTEYDQAEDIMRKIIPDYNYKLISATFEVLTEENKGNTGAGKIDYNTYKVHLKDNYSRFSNESALDTIIQNVKVEDEVDEQQLNKDSDTIEKSNDNENKADKDGN